MGINIEEIDLEPKINKIEHPNEMPTLLKNKQKKEKKEGELRLQSERCTFENLSGIVIELIGSQKKFNNIFNELFDKLN